MGLTKYGEGEVLPEPGKQAGSKEFSDADRKALAEENEKADAADDQTAD